EWIENFDKEIEESNHCVLLILDGASSHITGAITLTNIEMFKLSLYIISKIQPMDTNIIILFKLHYCHIQLEHTIDEDEARKSDIYKVNQLQAMRW
ncbi:10411_t:CDS:1, partial [Racocetra persica]